VPSIRRFLDTSDGNGKRAIEFEDGRIEADIDAVIFATGYLYSYPFLSLSPSANPSTPSNTTANGQRTPQTYHHLFHTPNPTLAYLTLPQKIVPFPTSQAQAAVLARVWSGRLTLPSKAEMEAWESARIAEKGEGKRFHYLDGGEDVSYLGALGEWADCARQPEIAGDGNGDGNGDGDRNDLGEDGRVGKAPPRWGEKERWMRERVGEIKKAWVSFGEERREVRTLEACGFDFETWKREQQEKQMNGARGDHHSDRVEKTDDVDEYDAANGGQAEG